jgi:hypothetical protein
MWDFITNLPTIWHIANAVDWGMIGWGLFLVSEALASIPVIKANSVFQAVYNFLARFKRD